MQSGDGGWAPTFRSDRRVATWCPLLLPHLLNAIEVLPYYVHQCLVVAPMCVR